MEGLENLNKIQSVNGLELVDGHASLNEEQLTDIEQELANGAQATERVTELEGENSTLTATVAKRDARIKELETALEAARGDNADDSAVIKRDTDGGGTDVPEDSFAAAKSFCENHLKKFK